MHYLSGTFVFVFLSALFCGRDGLKPNREMMLENATQKYSLSSMISEDSKTGSEKSLHRIFFEGNDHDAKDDEENYDKNYRINIFKRLVFSPDARTNYNERRVSSRVIDEDISDTLPVLQTTTDAAVWSTNSINPSPEFDSTSSTEFSPYFGQVWEKTNPAASTKYFPYFPQTWSEANPTTSAEEYPYPKQILDKTSPTVATKFSPYIEQRIFWNKTKNKSQVQNPWIAYTENSHPYETEHKTTLQDFDVDGASEFKVTQAAFSQNVIGTKNWIPSNEMLLSDDIPVMADPPTTVHPQKRIKISKNENFPTYDIEKIYLTKFSKVHVKTQVNKSSSTTLESYFTLKDDGASLVNYPPRKLFIPINASHSEANRNSTSSLEPSQSVADFLHKNTSRENISSTVSVKNHSDPSTISSNLSFTDEPTLLLKIQKGVLRNRPPAEEDDVSSKYDDVLVELGKSRNKKRIPSVSNEEIGTTEPSYLFSLPKNTMRDVDEYDEGKTDFSYHIYEEEQKNNITDNKNHSNEIKPFERKTVPSYEYTDDLLIDSFLYEQPEYCLSFHETCLWQALTPNSYIKTCMCAEACKIYGNCCLDYPLERINFNTHKEKQWSCVEVHSNVAYFMISSCPMDWPNSHVRMQCEDVTDSHHDKFRNVPVSGKITLLTYRNIHCAICNGDLDSEFWLTHLYCPYGVDPNKIITDDAAIHDCETGFSRPRNLLDQDILKNGNLVSLTRCDSTLISDCPGHWKLNTEYALLIWTKCLMVHAPIAKWEYDKIIKYKNVFCAVCHGVSNVQSLCPNAFQSHSKIPQHMPGKPSLSLLLDMDFTQGGMIVGSQERCPEMYLYDPWMGNCRHVMCGKNYIYKNGYCFPIRESLNKNISEQTISASNDSLNSSCLRVAYTSNEFLLYENGSIYLKHKNAFLQADQYEIVDNKTIGVCVDHNMMKYVETFTNVEGFLTIAGINISILALFIKIFCYLFSKERNKLPSKIVLFLSISLFSAQTLFLFGITRTNFHVLCIIIGILIHYFFLSTFCWMNILAYDIWKTFTCCKSIVKTFKPEKQLLKYCLYGWLAPLAIVLCSIMANWVLNNPTLNPSYGVALCWISNKVALLVFFGAPIAILLLINAYFFVVTAIAIRKTTVASKFALENNNSCGDRVQFGLYCKLACIMGLTWFFGFVAAFSGSIVLWYFFVIFNSIQGVYVFIAFTHFRCPKWLKVGHLKDVISRHTTTSHSSLMASSSVSKT